MKEISEVINEYENEINKVDIKDTYTDLLFRTRIFLKHEVCNLIELDNIENYKRIDSYSSFISNNGKTYYLYKKIDSNNLMFISRIFRGDSSKSGIGLGIDHISDEDSEKLLNLALQEKIINYSSKSSGMNTFGVILLVVGILLLSLLLILIGIVIIVIANNSNQLSDMEVKLEALRNIDKEGS